MGRHARFEHQRGTELASVQQQAWYYGQRGQIESRRAPAAAERTAVQQEVRKLIRVVHASVQRRASVMDVAVHTRCGDITRAATHSAGVAVLNTLVDRVDRRRAVSRAGERVTAKVCVRRAGGGRVCIWPRERAARRVERRDKVGGLVHGRVRSIVLGVSVLLGVVPSRVVM